MAAWLGGLGALLGGKGMNNKLEELLFGSDKQLGNIDTMTPEQGQALQQMLQGLGPEANQALMQLLQGGDPKQTQELFQQSFIDPGPIEKGNYD